MADGRLCDAQLFGGAGGRRASAYAPAAVRRRGRSLKSWPLAENIPVASCSKENPSQDHADVESEIMIKVFYK